MTETSERSTENLVQALRDRIVQRGCQQRRPIGVHASDHPDFRAVAGDLLFDVHTLSRLRNSQRPRALNQQDSSAAKFQLGSFSASLNIFGGMAMPSCLATFIFTTSVRTATFSKGKSLGS
jgi:hypothetical protein